MNASATNNNDEVDIRLLLLQISNDDQHAFSTVFKIFWNKVYTQSLVYLKSASVAEDVTQEIFFKIWSNRKSLPNINNFSSYLFITTRNAIISSLRTTSGTTMEPPERLEEQIWQPDKQLHNKELYTALMTAVELLPPARQKVFKMSRVEGMSYDEIATALNISRNGVKDHIVKALAFLREYLKQYAGPLFISVPSFYLFEKIF